MQLERAGAGEGDALREGVGELGNAAVADRNSDVVEGGTDADEDRAAVGGRNSDVAEDRIATDEDRPAVRGQRAVGDGRMLDRDLRAPAERLDRAQVVEAAIAVYVFERDRA